LEPPVLVRILGRERERVRESQRERERERDRERKRERVREIKKEIDRERESERERCLSTAPMPKKASPGRCHEKRAKVSLLLKPVLTDE
jgi:hypothetical protein